MTNFVDTDINSNCFKLEGDYFNQLVLNVRAKQISWNSLNKLNILDNNDIKILKDISLTKNQENGYSRASNVLNNYDLYTKSLINSIIKISNLNLKSLKDDENLIEILKILLTIFYDCLIYIKNFDLKILTNYCSIDKILNIFNNFLLFENDNLINILSIYFLTYFSTSDNENDLFKLNYSIYSKIIPNLINLIEIKYLKSSSINFQFIGLQYLKEILSIKNYRNYYSNNFDNLIQLINILSNNKIELQMKYLSIYCLWILTFDYKINKKLISSNSFDLINLILNISNDAIKEKVVRLSINILINLIETFENNNDDISIILKKCLLSNGLLIINNLINRKWSDEELKLDLTKILDYFTSSIKLLTNFDEYENELLNKKLIWSPCHKNPEFWVDNIDKFKQNNWKLIKSNLINLLDFNDNSINENQLYLNQAIVCYDLSMIIKVDPDVIKIINDLGIKTKIMTLMNSPNPNVKFEALKTTQLLVANSL